MKLEVGMYVRTKNGYIAKCTYIDEELESIYGFDSAIRRSFGDEYDFIYCKEQEKYIIKTSHNLIDLIEVGDYVNGYKVSAIYNPAGEDIIQFTLITEKGYKTINTYVNFFEIKSIVTREAFKNMSYHI